MITNTGVQLKFAPSRKGHWGEMTKRTGYWRAQKKGGGIKQAQLTKATTKITYASSSCFIFVNSSFVMDPSPSPSFCSFSLEASKSGLGGAGGIYDKRTKSLILHFYFLQQLYYSHHKRLRE